MPGENSHALSIEARLPPDALAVVERAAKLQGRTVGDFIAAAAKEAAVRTLEEARLVRSAIGPENPSADRRDDLPTVSAALDRAREIHRFARESDGVSAPAPTDEAETSNALLGCMREDAELMDEVVTEAYWRRQEPWRDVTP